MGKPVETFIQGQKVYTERGYEYEYFGEVDGVVLCCPAQMGFYGTPDGPMEYDYYGDPVIVEQQIFSKPPSPKLHADIAEQKAELERSKEELVEVRREIASLSRERFSLEKEAENHEAFRHLQTFICEEWTHCVKAERPPIIRERVGCYWNAEYVVKAGHSKGSICVENAFRKASSLTVHFSLKEAQEEVERQFESAIDEKIKDGAWSIHIDDWTDRHDFLKVPQRWNDHLEAEKAKAAIEKRARLEAELAALEAPNE